jgi:hypothetical protein
MRRFHPRRCVHTLRFVSDKRREVRYAARITARIKRRNQMIEMLTNDVSFRGVFIRTDSPPALRQLVKVELVLPDKVVVSGHAMVVHVAALPAGAAKGEGQVPGIGLQFWGPIEHAKQWEQFIHALKQRQRTGTPAATPADKVRRASERFKLAIEVVFGGERSMTRDVSENGMAIRTDLKMPIGGRAQLELRSEQGTMVFDVIVRRAINEPDFKGLGIELVEMAPDRRAELVKFIRANAPSEERILVPPGDPKLH